ncbi:MAG: hypothetical protein E7638_02880, partial [Ruminococcaceae bacterium]|nr:hypothetical protein [Oscillospiraceae bacterium]
LVLGGVAALPFLPAILPASIVSRYFDIGNMADTSTSYRVGGWQASLAMLKDNILAGIGVGGDAWSKVYPQYSLLAMESTPHAHNLYIQLVIDLGIMGLAAYLFFLFFLYQSGFTFFSRLSDEGLLLPESLGAEDVPRSVDANRNIRRTRSDLRIMAAAPLCGVIAVLVQGMVENIWYNYRVYLMIWLVTGLASAAVRTGTALVDESERGEGDSEAYTVDVMHFSRGSENKAKKSP